MFNMYLLRYNFINQIDITPQQAIRLSEFHIMVHLIFILFFVFVVVIKLFESLVNFFL